jgi:stearoyl-CoA desaturase (Delta-9 desaturase)
MTTTEALLDPLPPEGDPTGDAAADAVVIEPEMKKTWEQVALFLFITVPFLAVFAAIPVAWGWGLSWRDIIIAAVMYLITGHGVTVGFHRHFTHKAFKARRWVQVTLAIAGMMAIQGPVLRWVADHRAHHRFSDHDGDPHSPWRYGNSIKGLTKGIFYSHVGWLFDMEQTSADKFAPDLVKDRVLSRVSRAFPIWVVISMLLPPLVGGLWSWSWQGALTAFFWGSLVRVGLLYHVTFSINSICHVTGRTPFKTKDRSRNVWWLAIPSMGESWHNFHHAEPTSARHGVRLFEIDSSAMIIWVMERLRFVSEVRWPDAASIARRKLSTAPVG